VAGVPGSDDGALTAAVRAAVSDLDDASPAEAVAAYERLHARLAEALDAPAQPAGPGG
jgi:hypothetical protein